MCWCEAERPLVLLPNADIIGSFFLVDKHGRRPILIWGMVGMAASLCSAGLSSMVLEPGSTTLGNIGIFCVVAYMFAFGASWGYGAWLYIPEIMPLRVRGKAVGLCTFINWGPANNLSATLTPWLLQVCCISQLALQHSFQCCFAQRKIMAGLSRDAGERLRRRRDAAVLWVCLRYVYTVRSLLFAGDKGTIARNDPANVRIQR